MGCKLLYINAFASEVGAKNDKRASGKLQAGRPIGLGLPPNLRLHIGAQQ